jgi:Sec7-like guanine-nucleotide exchange factor
MFAANDSSAGRKHAIGLENYVRRLLSCFESTDRLVNLNLHRLHVHGCLERIVNSAFEIVTRLNKERFSSIVRHGAFADLTVCITDFCKVNKYQKISLLSIAMLRGVIPIMLESPLCSLTPNGDPQQTADDDPMIKYWFPVLFGFYDIIMNGEDLEVRRL